MAGFLVVSEGLERRLKVGFRRRSGKQDQLLLPAIEGAGAAAFERYFIGRSVGPLAAMDQGFRLLIREERTGARLRLRRGGSGRPGGLRGAG
jgi:hypothetical protein